MTLLRRLCRMFSIRLGMPANTQRWVAIDVEASGLDRRHDRLIAIAAIALRLDTGVPRISLGDSFEVVLRQPELAVDKANILRHGIGVGAQRAGVEPAVALAAFESWLGDAPLIAFHADFAATLLRRATRSALGRRLDNPWVDLEVLAAALHPTQRARSPDEWLAHFHIDRAVRHQAAADALATAELMLRLWPVARAQMAASDFDALRRLAAQGRWLHR